MTCSSHQEQAFISSHQSCYAFAVCSVQISCMRGLSCTACSFIHTVKATSVKYFQNNTLDNFGCGPKSMMVG